MIQETLDRIRPLVPLENIFVSTTATYRPLVTQELPELLPENIIVEPETRNTAPAIALVATLIQVRDSEAVIATIASDHAIQNTDEFEHTIRAALQAADNHPDKLVIIGINPTKPDTGLGYIKLGQEVTEILGKRVFEVNAFKEKPDRTTAEEYLRSFDYLWNAGYFIFSAKNFTVWAKEFAPMLAECMQEIATHQKAGALDEKKLQELYIGAPSEPFDIAIVEKLPVSERLVIPSALKWSDVGNWDSLHEFLAERSGNHSVIHGHHIGLGSKNILVQSEKKLVVTIGLEDIVIVDTDDALLVARRDQVAGNIKKIIEKLKEENQDELL